MVVGQILGLLSKPQHLVFLGWTMTVFWEINLIEMENGFYFAFECVFILSSPTPLTQGEEEDLFEIVVLMIKAIDRI